MRDINYVNEQELKNDWLWQQEKKNLYYNSKNKEYITPTFLICSFLFFVKGGIVCIALILLFVFYLCKKNNQELDDDYYILKKREEYKYYRKTYMNNIENKEIDLNKLL